MLIPLSKQMPNSAKQKDKKKRNHTNKGAVSLIIQNKQINLKILVYSFHCRSVLNTPQSYGHTH
ncbi:hypothetical protein Ornrh_2189 [Ornithobacterium rhinotracheale DSM 15997]|uniref:Uncharacterized protein n=1 Tax=Ornithobacterium rhinotracheale (strain ATCC 51463 / DSM 15997 / CCUG 23171 / CIP 104009 / LMG 9086) TaxID=867902 RepID=I4A2Y7_ORNRL|nr:hypothetical protein Ornrh_0439 [Ornithobacterium rhinotracheale DSM 15997]AFL97686.1 hypothetical protein Ornrh_1520 [Ornithobacterium rhinotracheale DSM 15997]AFL98321.1 hypothetical protein Ornrh_2189 [Ornithobacterium rhinotracheale DSM 15997]